MFCCTKHLLEGHDNDTSGLECGWTGMAAPALNQEPSLGAGCGHLHYRYTCPCKLQGMPQTDVRLARGPLQCLPTMAFVAGSLETCMHLNARIGNFPMQLRRFSRGHGYLCRAEARAAHRLVPLGIRMQRQTLPHSAHAQSAPDLASTQAQGGCRRTANKQTVLSVSIHHCPWHQGSNAVPLARMPRATGCATHEGHAGCSSNPRSALTYQ
jgi:hypothetical protein